MSKIIYRISIHASKKGLSTKVTEYDVVKEHSKTFTTLHEYFREVDQEDIDVNEGRFIIRKSKLNVILHNTVNAIGEDNAFIMYTIYTFDKEAGIKSLLSRLKTFVGNIEKNVLELKKAIND